MQLYVSLLLGLTGAQLSLGLPIPEDREISNALPSLADLNARGVHHYTPTQEDTEADISQDHDGTIFDAAANIRGLQPLGASTSFSSSADTGDLGAVFGDDLLDRANVMPSASSLKGFGSSKYRWI
ncbi:hypothetical protein ACMFMF_007901 [Clarireedia jacksonii]